MNIFLPSYSATVSGVDGFCVVVEVDVSGGLPCLEIVGMPDTSVREAKHRVRSAVKIRTSKFLREESTVNLAPAYKKRGRTSWIWQWQSLFWLRQQIAELAYQRVRISGQTLALDGIIKACARSACHGRWHYGPRGSKALLFPWKIKAR